MKANWRRYAQYLPVLLAAGLLIIFSVFNGFFKLRPRDVGNNPDHFRLWVTNSEFSYTFIYDPLAADNWLREAAVWSSDPILEAIR